MWTTKNGFSLYRCATCKLIFVAPIPETSALIYNEEYFDGATHGFGYVNYDEDKEPMIPVFEEYLRLIMESLGRTGTLLDVGAATGFFVRLAINRGFKAEGIELSTHAASRAQARGLPVRGGTLADVEGRFDCITMLDVIEHVPDPKREIEKVATLLPPGGILVINTPDAGSLFARALGKRWHLLVPPEHLFYFNRDNMQHLLEERGFEVLKNTTIGKSFTLSYIAKTLYKWTSFSPFNWVASLCAHSILRRIAIPLNLRDNMFVLARKK